MKEVDFSVGFESPDAIVPDCAISTDEGVNYEGIQRWDVTEERNGVIGIMDNVSRRNGRGKLIPIPEQQSELPQASVVNSIRGIIQEQPDESRFVLLIKGSMVASGPAEKITATILHIIHNDQSVSDDDIVILKEIDLKDFFNIPSVKDLLNKIKQKDSQK